MPSDAGKTDSRSLYIIKPEAFRFRSRIRRQIMASELTVVLTCEFVLDSEQAHDVYRALPLDRKIPAVRSLFGGPVEIGVVEGSRAVERLVSICGTHSVPSECSPGTIRREFGTGWDLSDPAVPILRNAIHRCKSAAQAAETIAWLLAMRRAGGSPRRDVAAGRQPPPR